MIKLIACDMDGTLLDDTKELSLENCETLIKWQQQGVKVALASGRNINRLDKYAKQLKLAEYGGLLIEANGASVVDYADDTHEIMTRMSREEALEVIELLKPYQEEIIVMGTTNAFILPQNASGESEWMKVMGPESGYGREIIVVDSFDKVDEEINKICAFSVDVDKIAFMNNDLKAKDDKYWHGIVHDTWLEIMPKNLNKGNALEYVMHKYQLKPEEVMCFGDSDNDVSMIQKVKYSIAMSNAFDRIKALCYDVTKDNNHSGVAAYLKQFKGE